MCSLRYGLRIGTVEVCTLQVIAMMITYLLPEEVENCPDSQERSPGTTASHG
jgi:hypothetical protein